MKLHAVLVALAVLVAFSPASAAEIDPTLPYHAVRSNPVTYDVDFTAVVTPLYIR